MKTKTAASLFGAAWLTGVSTVSAQWTVVVPPQQPPQRVSPAQGIRNASPALPARPAFPQQGEWRTPPPPPQQQTVAGRETVVVRPFAPQEPERRPNPPRRRPDRREADRRIAAQEAYAYGRTYDYGGGGRPPAGHYDLRGNRDIDMMGGRDPVVVGDDGRREASPPKVRYPKGAVVLGEFNAGGDAKEVVVNREISRCYLELVSGVVSINTVVVRPEKTALPQTVRLSEGRLHVVDLGGKRVVSGFRISDNGRGVYRVIVQ